MRDIVSLYEAKAKLSALIRRVREGHRVVVTVHGKAVAEIRPIEPQPASLAQRLDQLVDRGILVRPETASPHPGSVARRPGALKRFLTDRHR